MKTKSQKLLCGGINPRIALFATKVLVIVCTCLSFGWYLVPCFVRFQIGKKISISPEDSPEFYSLWLQPPIPVYFKVYLFNVSNPHEIEAGNLPKFHEVGPYVFQEIRKKINISLNDTADIATYQEYVTYQFLSEMSGNLSLNDVVTVINVPFVSAAIMIERNVPWPFNHVPLMILLNYKAPLFVQKTVDEALFKGWKVPFLEQIEEEIGLSFLKNNTFQFFLDMNDTVQGPYTIQRGVQGDKRLLGNMIKYKNEPQLPFWGNPDTPCNVLKGTDGFIFPPFMTKDTILTAFNSDLCGKLNLIYNNTVTVEGVSGYRFLIPLTELASPLERIESRCLCETADTEPERCLKSGTMDMGPCRDGAPIALSSPHFLDCDPVYLETVAEGVKPERELHKTYIDIEPLTGIVLRANKRIQLNVILSRVPEIPSLSKVPKMLFPFVWADQGASIDEPNASRIGTVLLFIKLGENFSKYGTLLLAIVIPALLLRRDYMQGQGEKENETYVNVNKNEQVDHVSLDADAENFLKCCGEYDPYSVSEND